MIVHYLYTYQGVNTSAFLLSAEMLSLSQYKLKMEFLFTV